MGDDRDDDPKAHAVRSLGFLWKAAREAATGIRKEVKQNSVGKAIDDAGREVARAANNVATRIGVGEMLKKVKSADPRKPSGDKPKGPTEEDPGFWMAEDEDEKKKKK